MCSQIRTENFGPGINNEVIRILYQEAIKQIQMYFRSIVRRGYKTSPTQRLFLYPIDGNARKIVFAWYVA